MALPRAASRTALLLAALAVSAPAPTPPPAPITFEAQWQDGRAELAGYRYRVTRYGERREGRCAMITVTEPFSASKRVKADDPSRNPADTFEALKLNLVRQFQTGIYDYHTMVSLFMRSRDFAPVKVAFTCAEWCGQVYEEQAFGAQSVDGFIRSYFEDESGATRLPMRRGGIAEDDLFILLRGLRGDYLPPGRVRSVPLLPSPFRCRLIHQRPAWVVADIARAREPVAVTVPAGRFRALLYTVQVADGRIGRFWIEAAPPRRVLQWTWTADAKRGRGVAGDGLDEGALIRSKRLPYWKLHGRGDERLLRDIGLDR